MTNELMMKLAALENQMTSDQYDYEDGYADYRYGQPIRTNPTASYLAGWIDSRANQAAQDITLDIIQDEEGAPYV